MSTSGIHAKVQEVKDQTRIERIGAHSHIRGKRHSAFNNECRFGSRRQLGAKKDLAGYGRPGKQ